SGGVQWLTGAFGYSVIVPFDLSDQDKALLENAASDPQRQQVLVINTMKLKRPTPNAEDQKWVTSRNLPVESHALGPALPGEDLVPMPVSALTLRVLDTNLSVMFPETQINGGKMAVKPGVDPMSTDPYSIPTF